MNDTYQSERKDLELENKHLKEENERLKKELKQERQTIREVPDVSEILRSQIATNFGNISEKSYTNEL